VDVGGSRKGFHLAVLDAAGRLVVAGERITTARGVVERLRPLAPVLVAVDAPRRPAERGERSRACEREFVRASICALRFTPDLREIRSNPFHEWVLRGLELYAALDRTGLPAIECFPTAAWTVWAGRRSGKPRGAWSGRALERLSVPGSPPRLGQDGRDAIAAALTARLHTFGHTLVFGELVVPLPGLIGTQQLAHPRDGALRGAASGVNRPRPPRISHAQRQ
jgi:predicted nuclease with RNAse H fold